MDGEQLSTHRDGPVAWITFDHPERLNALTPAMSRSLGAAVEALRGDGDVRVVVVRGSGDRAFMSGADIGALPTDGPGGPPSASDGPPPDRLEAFAAGGPGVLLRLPQPVIALIHGWCLGGGLLTALCCDLRIAADDARFGIPAARLGVGYPYVATELLVQRAGAAAAAEILLTGERFDAGEAQRLGLVHRVLPKAELDATVAELAASIATNAPLSLAAAKTAIAAVTGGSQPAAVDAAEAAIAACWRSDDLREGRAAFAERRRPQFQGR